MATEKPENPLDNSVSVTQENQAEGGGLFGVSSGWYNSFIQQAKEKTLSTYELVKKDIDEFSTTVQSEATNIASATATVIRDQASSISHILNENEEKQDGSSSPSTSKNGKEKTSPKKKQQSQNQEEDEGDSWEGWGGWGKGGEWMSSIVQGVNKVLAVEDTTVGEEKMEIPVTKEGFTRSQARLFAIQTDIGTYTKEPDGASELFDDWLESFSLEEQKNKISHLLGMNPQMRNIYAQLVPSNVSNKVFWERYFYKVHVFELDEARRAALLKRSSQKDADVKEKLDLKTSWGDSEDDNVISDQESPIPSTKSSEPTENVIIAEPAGGEAELTPRPSEGSAGPETPRESQNEAKSEDKSMSHDASPAETKTPPEKDKETSSTDSWSVCSAKDISELPDSPPAPDTQMEDVEEGREEPTTPKETTPPAKKEKKEKSDKDDEDWIDWDSD